MEREREVEKERRQEGRKGNKLVEGGRERK